jgi:outer membrane scaffolding protein for murein synthesis (MipA/OmpV family)
VEYQSRAQTRYYYGTTDADAVRLQRGYRPGPAAYIFPAAMIEPRITGHWYANVHLRHSVLDEAVCSSPLVSRNSRSSALAAAAYRF